MNHRLHFLLPALLLACCLALLGPARAVAQSAPGQQLVVLELFTSQGCASCPPADKLMREWVAKPAVLALSLHVDYWDYLGWRDTLGKRYHSDRQQAYARKIGTRQVYTPQMVVNGQYVAVGSNREAVQDAIQAARRDQYLPLTTEYDAAGQPVRLLLPGLASWQGEAVARLCLYDRRREVAVERGENQGKQMTYLNVERSWVELARWQGQPMSLEIGAQLKDIDWQERGAVLLLRA